MDNPTAPLTSKLHYLPPITNEEPRCSQGGDRVTAWRMLASFPLPWLQTPPPGLQTGAAWLSSRWPHSQARPARCGPCKQGSRPQHVRTGHSLSRGELHTVTHQPTAVVSLQTAKVLLRTSAACSLFSCRSRSLRPPGPDLASSWRPIAIMSL